MASSIPTKCRIILVIACILAVLSTFSLPALAVSRTFYVVPSVYDSSLQTNVVGTYSVLSLDVEDSIFYHYSPLDISYYPLDAVGGTVTATGELDFSASETISDGDVVQVLCVPNGTGTVQPYITTVTVGASGTWNTRIDNATILGIVNDESTSSGSGSVSMSFDMPSSSTTYNPGLLENDVGDVIASKPVAELFDTFPGGFFSWPNRSYNGFGFSSVPYTASSFPKVGDLIADTLGLSVYAGETYRLRFAVISDQFPSLFYLYRVNPSTGKLTSLTETFANYSFTVSDLHAINISEDPANPSSLIYYVAEIDISVLQDFVLHHIYFGPSTPVLSGISRNVFCEIIDSDRAVVDELEDVNSKLQELLEYYAQNPPEADDLRAQTEMQHALEAAAIEDAKGSVSGAAQAAAPGTVVVDPGGGAITIGSALTTWTATINSFVSAVPMLAVILAFFVFCALVRYLLQR